MTVVMQHWYDGLDVTDNGFYVTLNFGDTPAPLYIPYGALKTFVDPSVEFGLKFENQNDETEEPVGPDDSLLGKLELPEGPEEKAPAAEVVSLDSFRK